MRKSMLYSFLSFLLVSFALAVALPARAETAAEIDAKVAASLNKFRKHIQGADDYLSAAKGVLIIPDVRKVGFVVAAQWGTGAMQVGGRNVGYYKMEAGSAGFQAGYKKADYVFVFFTEHALNRFRSGKGWEVGADAGLTFVEVGTGVGVDTLKSQNAVAAFSFAQEGLMGGWSAKGTKFTRINP